MKKSIVSFKLCVVVIFVTIVVGCLPLPSKGFEVYKADYDQFNPKKVNYFINPIYIKQVEFSDPGST